MVALADGRHLKDISQKKCITNGNKISKKYRKAAIKKAEYRKLKAIVPSVANKKTVSKLTVIEEAIKYIDQLHSALVRKVFMPDSNNNHNTSINGIDISSSHGNPVLHNLQLSCDNNKLPFRRADDFITNFILQQQQQQRQQQHRQVPTHRRPLANPPLQRQQLQPQQLQPQLRSRALNLPSSTTTVGGSSNNDIGSTSKPGQFLLSSNHHHHHHHHHRHLQGAPASKPQSNCVQPSKVANVPSMIEETTNNERGRDALRAKRMLF